MYRFYSKPKRELISQISDILSSTEKRASHDIVSRIQRVVNKRKNLATVAVVGSYENGELRLAVARCSIKDTFSKIRGRSIAEQRLLNSKFHSILTMENAPTGKEFVKIAREVAENVKKDATKILA